jgi:UDP-N-acetylglucosamine--N-acetylmuramyl-(pentapeptide) pyrophosphoryl-undecaprenol N-acetylglucosamine transferase
MTVANSSSSLSAQYFPKLLVAASGTGGHVFPALAVAQALSLTGYTIEWLGVPDRLETRLVPKEYPLHTVKIAGIQKGLSLQTLKLLGNLITATWQTRQLLQRGKFTGVLAAGGYISAPAIIAARSLGLPAILHESNALPGKVTRFLSGWCSAVALGFAEAAQHLPKATTEWVGTPVRDSFLQLTPLQEIPVVDDAPLIVVMGGSQGAVALNKMVRQAATSWLEAGAWVVHLVGQTDPDAQAFSHPHYLPLPFFENMAGLLQRADLCISRSGASSLTELGITGTPSILVPYPFAAEDHQTINAQVFAKAGASKLYQQKDLTQERLAEIVLKLLNNPEELQRMGERAMQLSVPDSTEQLAELIHHSMG